MCEEISRKLRGRSLIMTIRMKSKSEAIAVTGFLKKTRAVTAIEGVSGSDPVASLRPFYDQNSKMSPISIKKLRIPAKTLKHPKFHNRQFYYTYGFGVKQVRRWRTPKQGVTPLLHPHDLDGKSGRPAILRYIFNLLINHAEDHPADAEVFVGVERGKFVAVRPGVHHGVVMREFWRKREPHSVGVAEIYPAQIGLTHFKRAVVNENFGFGFYRGGRFRVSQLIGQVEQRDQRRRVTFIIVLVIRSVVAHDDLFLAFPAVKFDRCLKTGIRPHLIHGIIRLGILKIGLPAELYDLFQPRGIDLELMLYQPVIYHAIFPRSVFFVLGAAVRVNAQVKPQPRHPRHAGGVVADGENSLSVSGLETDRRFLALRKRGNRQECDQEDDFHAVKNARRRANLRKKNFATQRTQRSQRKPKMSLRSRCSRWQLHHFYDDQCHIVMLFRPRSKFVGAVDDKFEYVFSAPGVADL